ncbi:POK7 protein, partial [Arenaria interpres]|nr:POK7 protein [Arenaria interpres]
LTEGNAVADSLTAAVLKLDFARASHSFFHQNAQGLSKQFQIPLTQAKDIIRVCPECLRLTPLPAQTRVNPCGLRSNDIWQSDVTHYSPFGCLQYVHVSVDTFSGTLCASVH